MNNRNSISGDWIWNIGKKKKNGFPLKKSSNVVHMADYTKMKEHIMGNILVSIDDNECEVTVKEISNWCPFFKDEYVGGDEDGSVHLDQDSVFSSNYNSGEEDNLHVHFEVVNSSCDEDCPKEEERELYGNLCGVVILKPCMVDLGWGG
ncbi:hypothetical protein L1987_43139 [Smallanthus sonchifolius]|uniref:Uncharacterized protein n=1 Tax=Smallanthus sonchifolius TaxID=185202 RepID=A0ACB9GMT9_9ASTR|nr:hypothetical protein L1987_43139 [Smallanthus sonchifolius]